MLKHLIIHFSLRYLLLKWSQTKENLKLLALKVVAVAY